MSTVVLNWKLLIMSGSMTLEMVAALEECYCTSVPDFSSAMRNMTKPNQSRRNIYYGHVVVPSSSNYKHYLWLIKVIRKMRNGSYILNSPYFVKYITLQYSTSLSTKTKKYLAAYILSSNEQKHVKTSKKQ